MRILVVTDKLTLDGRSPSCIALNLRDTAPRFHARGCKLAVCNLRVADPGADLLRAAGLTVFETGCKSASPRTLPALLRQARNSRADLLHAHGYAAANFGRLAGHRLGVPVVVHEHALLPVRPHQYLVDWLLRRWTTRGVAISQAVAGCMTRRRSVPPERIDVIPNGIDLSRYQAVSHLAPAAARKRFGWPETAQMIGSAARFRREKGLPVLLEAVLRLMPRYPELWCVMAGDGPDRADLQQQAAATQQADRLVFPGFVEAMPPFLRAMTVLAIPSLQEGLSFAAMEAMATGVPVVASRTGGLPELIADGVTGLLTPPGDSAALAGALERVLTDTTLQRRLVRNAARAVQAYDADRYADRITALYRRLLEPANR